MRRSIAPLLLALAAGLALAGCGKGAQVPSAPQSAEEVETVLAELDSFNGELLKKIEGAPDPLGGVRQAQEFLNVRKQELSTKFSSLKQSRSFRESDETRKRVLEKEVDGVLKVASLRTKFMGETMNNPAFREQLDVLVNDYQTLFK